MVTLAGMRDVIILFVPVIVTVVRRAGPGGLRSVVAASALIRHPLLILNRGRQRAPNLRASDRMAAGLFTLLVERLMGTLRREYLDRTLFWTTVDPDAKLTEFQQHYNGHRAHAGLEGGLPEPGADGSASPINFESYRWRRHCRGLYQTPIAA